jgi:DUF1680 family protein
LPGAGKIELVQETQYPFAGLIKLRIADIERDGASFGLSLRIPAWAEGARLKLNGEEQGRLALHAGTNVQIERNWRQGDELMLELPMPILTHRRVHQNTQESRAPDGSAVRQQVLHQQWLALSRGPLVYATRLIDGFKTEETIRLPDAAESTWLRTLDATADEEGPTIEMNLGYRAPLNFQPYYRAGGREDGAWRLTWLSLPPLSEPTS